MPYTHLRMRLMDQWYFARFYLNVYIGFLFVHRFFYKIEWFLTCSIVPPPLSHAPIFGVCLCEVIDFNLNPWRCLVLSVTNSTCSPMEVRHIVASTFPSTIHWYWISLCYLDMQQYCSHKHFSLVMWLPMASNVMIISFLFNDSFYPYHC